MKITGKVEQIFAHAVALEQNGGLRNTIYGLKKHIFIMNYDHTVLLKFLAPKGAKGEKPPMFDPPISFKANDYDSNEFEQDGNKIIFTSEKNGYLRTKTCGTTELTPMDVSELYDKYTGMVSGERVTMTIDRGILELLDDALSHIEFIAKVGEEIQLIQRNIYSGGIIKVQKTKAKEGKTVGVVSEKAENNVGPIALKTGDFHALFTFTDVLKFHFPIDGNGDFVFVENYDTKFPFKGILACCLYDEVIKIKEVQPDISKKKLKRKK